MNKAIYEKIQEYEEAKANNDPKKAEELVWETFYEVHDWYKTSQESITDIDFGDGEYD